MRAHRQKRSKSDARFDRNLGPKVTLRRQMSEVISLREQVAQAELAAKRYGLSAKPEIDPATER